MLQSRPVTVRATGGAAAVADRAGANADVAGPGRVRREALVSPGRFAAARGFMFDIDGTLIQRAPDHSAVPIDGAREVLEAIRASGRPLVAFTNGSHVTPARIAAGIRKGGLELSEHEVLTPTCSAISLLQSKHDGERVMVFGTESTRSRMAASGIDVVEPADARSARGRGGAARRRGLAARAGGGGLGDHRRRPLFDRQQGARLRGRRRPDHLARRDVRGGDREGFRPPADGRRQAVAGGRRAKSATASASRRATSRSWATTSAWTSRWAGWRRRERRWWRAG